MYSDSRKKVFVGLSGGVDSSVAALLLKEAGFDVFGIHIRGYNVDGCGDVDAEYARRAAESLKIPFYVWDMEKEYKKEVVDYMVKTYEMGLTPNPDVMCNKEIKFGLFLKRALEAGAHYIATGHYVKISRDDEGKIYKLFEAADENKDQSYFLWTLGSRELKHCLFPLGDLIKPEVREIARKAGLPTADKKDSQGVCFLGKIGMEGFLKQYISETPGEIITVEGKIIGSHRGLSFYTIGQRHLGLKDIHGSQKNGIDTEPIYVADKDFVNNRLIVAEGDNNPALFKNDVILREANYTDKEIRSGEKIKVRVRYRQPLCEAVFWKEDDKVKIVFDKPQKFVAPGQSAVIYGFNGECFGGGVII